MKAEKWFQKAAEQGNVEAQMHLSDAFFKGQGVGENYIQAYVWILFTALNDESILPTTKTAIASNKDAIKRKMNSQLISKAQKMILIIAT